MLKEQLAASLEEAFSRCGFAEPSVAQLKTACNVSLRTLYKYYPSKEAMIVGALEFRHQRYLKFLREDAPKKPEDATLFIFEQLEVWMKEFAPHGCLSMNAIAAFPDNELMNRVVKEHKKEVQQLLGELSQRPDLSVELFLLHEGVSSAWSLVGKTAVISAKSVALRMLSAPL
ncbi:TetR/AcrR family transcriptional regulator [Vibrio kagoshimensis]|uniref:TetR/AcrR family transcriptional regulator n=1 Tax=Vibrio kagoshimensis TaxID=2910244 RepID=UPI003D1DCC69